MSLATKIATLKQKAVEITVKEVKLPENAASPLDLFASNSNAETGFANEWIIDVFPSQVPIFMYITKIASQAAALIDHKHDPKSSLFTVTMYYMALLHAFLLLNDLHVRPDPSAHAASWSTLSWKHSFATWLLTLPVPDSMLTIFSQLAASQTDKTGNVFFIPSAAGFNHRHFFGRFIPLNFFAHMHDAAATIPGNTAPIKIHNDLFSSVLYELKGATTFTSLFADIIGITIQDGSTTTGHYCASKWYQNFNKVFNPVLFRDFQRRSELASLDLQTPKFKTLDPNAYDILFSATPNNLKELKSVLQLIATQLSGSVPMKSSLSQVISSGSGNNITHHGYSTFALPTWTNHDQSKTDQFSAITSLKKQDPEDRAKQLSFLQPRTRPTASTTVTAATAGGHASAVVSGLTWPWSLIITGTSTDPFPNISEDSKDVVIYNDLHNLYPDVLVLDTLGTSTVTAHLATLSGKIIETFEIDGTTIELPSALKNVGMQNCMFADSAIPFKYCVYATKFKPGQTDKLLPPLARAAPVSTPRLPASSILHDRLKIMLPTILGATTVGTASIIDGNVPANPPGLTGSSPTNWLYYTQSFLGFRTVSKDNDKKHDDIDSTPYGRLLVWSPYTYTPYEDADNATLAPDHAESRSYFLTNLRTLFGTDTNIVKVKHPLDAMPL